MAIQNFDAKTNSTSGGGKIQGGKTPHQQFKDLQALLYSGQINEMQYETLLCNLCTKYSADMAIASPSASDDPPLPAMTRTFSLVSCYPCPFCPCKDA